MRELVKTEQSFQVERIAQELRYEQFHLLTNNCFIKSIRFRSRCKALGIPAKAMACLGKARISWLGYRFVVPTIHGFGELNGEHIEVAHRLDRLGVCNVVDGDIVPVFTVRI